jgi:hypothetical protein
VGYEPRHERIFGWRGWRDHQWQRLRRGRHQPVGRLWLYGRGGIAVFGTGSGFGFQTDSNVQ